MAAGTPPTFRPRRWHVALLLSIVAVLLGLATATAVAQPSAPPSPQPSPPSTASPPPTVNVPQTAKADSECGITDLTACVRDGFSSFVNVLVGESLNWLLRLLGDTLLSTPTLDQLPRIGEIWGQSRLF